MEKKITIYTASSMFGVLKIEGKLIETGTADYAQYKNCPFVTYIEKGKRTPRRILVTYKPYLIVVEGHGHPDPEDPMQPVEKGEGFTTAKSKYSSCDDRYQTDFDTKIKDHLKTAMVLVDYRYTVKTEYMVNAAYFNAVK